MYRVRRRWRLGLLLIGVSALASCSSTRSSSSLSGLDLDAVGLEQLRGAGPDTRTGSLARASIGSLLMLPETGDGSVKVLHEYQAASGRSCRRVLIADSRLIRVMCQRRGGDWTLTRALIENTGQQATVADQMTVAGAATRAVIALSDLPAQAAGAADEDTVSDDLMQGESLWRFAKRVTGDATNWQSIAELNGIEKPDRVRAGETLLIPAHLMKRMY